MINCDSKSVGNKGMGMNCNSLINIKNLYCLKKKINFIIKIVWMLLIYIVNEWKLMFKY